MDSLDLERYRRALEATRQEQLARLKTLRGEGLGDAAQEAARELSSYDQHPADQGTETFEREKDTGFEAAARGILEQIDEALGRMEAGLYGICATCGEPIDPARLDALPYALRCAPCEAAVEERRRRVVEAAAAPPSFMRGFGAGVDRVAFDGEETWEDLARYGTANTLQDVPEDPEWEGEEKG